MMRLRLLRTVALAAVFASMCVPVYAQDPHAGHVQENPASPPSTAAPPGGADRPEQPRPLPSFIPALTDDDRKAAFPDVEGHTIHGNRVNYFVLLDQFEAQMTRGARGANLDSQGWVGGDRDRLWFRAEGEIDDGEGRGGQAHLLYGRQFSRWWDVVAGIRQDLEPGGAQTWAAFGVQGLAPYWFEIEATAYVGAGGRTHARVEVEYELLLTNRLILQPLVEAEVSGTSDRDRGVGAGLSTTDAGLRVRYEWRREVAPYVGLTWNRRWGRTAGFAREQGKSPAGARVVAGLRLWF